jgi:hypothetical protein
MRWPRPATRRRTEDEVNVTDAKHGQTTRAYIEEK